MPPGISFIDPRYKAASQASSTCVMYREVQFIGPHDWANAQLMNGQRSITVAFSGDLDLAARDSIAFALPEPTGLDRLVIDCTAVCSMEPVVVSVFMRYRRKWIAAGSDPLNIVFLATPELRRTFDITGMSEWFTIVTAQQDAQAASQQPQPQQPLP
jgi:anti-anti-sigma regulatory factor